MLDKKSTTETTNETQNVDFNEEGGQDNLKELQDLQAQLEEQIARVKKDIEQAKSNDSGKDRPESSTLQEHDDKQNGNDDRVSNNTIDPQELERVKSEHIRVEMEFIRDEQDIEECMERERRFQVQWNRLSRNKVWKKKAGPPVTVYNESVEEYKGPVGKHIWPRGRNLNELSVYGQIYDFTRFMWGHTKPYKTVFMIVLMAFGKPLTAAAMSFVAGKVEADPKSVPFWLYLTTFFVECYNRILYWWYEMWVPLNSQRVQMRSVLLSKRTSLPESHPMAIKWPKGRFTALLKDVDEVINGIWKTCLSGFDDLVSVIWLLVLCFSNLAVSKDTVEHNTGEDLSKTDYGVYVAVFLSLGVLTMVLPILWFNMVCGKVQICESMVREGQALYMSHSGAAISHPTSGVVGRKAFRVYGLTTFRSFFYSLAWKTNFSLFMKFLSGVAAYGILTSSGFGEGGLTSTLIILFTLSELAKLSPILLDKCITMSKGCHVLRDVAELLNAKLEGDYAEN
mmetsp:Transcript_29450/g.43468  ORF Transcript_29450/g.43468 Transcript_29450/m.43468 type:complete len:509 (+) Transcript_29450:157-1683(+)|eukprot:CAMPEP_0194212592 /NCGR_PEP_ID=MMETSP0156-20130528/12644_1 /TAXON_ID=33649 /ORGANISM="Thalassionema nitzschioides, Strain L26-B" /LENGTH=508 /DNA_ID=CAMNT_0038940461 /DNA_START=94 /DNA_END=1620 /DNA_ORIENTATION=-